MSCLGFSFLALSFLQFQLKLNNVESLGSTINISFLTTKFF